MSLSNILGGALIGLGQGYDQIQDEQTKLKREDQKAERDMWTKVLLDADSPPSQKKAARDRLAKLFGNKPEALQLLDQLAPGQPTQTGTTQPVASGPPPVMQAIGVPSEPRPLQRSAPPPVTASTSAAAPPPAPEGIEEIPVPTRADFAQQMGVPYATEDDIWNFKRQGYEAEYLRHVEQALEFNRQLKLAKAGEQRKQAEQVRRAEALRALIPVMTDPKLSRAEKIARAAAAGFTAQEVHDMLDDGTKSNEDERAKYISITAKPTTQRTPEEKSWALAYEQEKKLTGEAGFERMNPGAENQTVSFIVDQLLQPGGEKYWTSLVGSDRTLQGQVRAELTKRGIPMEQLTSSTRQLGETARTLIPKMESAIRLLNDPKVQAKLGPIMGRWNEFMAGTVGKGDPDFVKIRTAASFIQTGTMRAHVGARGGQQLLAKFENLINAKQMDAATLQASLEAAAAFLSGYRDALTRDVGGSSGPSATPPPGGGRRLVYDSQGNLKETK